MITVCESSQTQKLEVVVFGSEKSVDGFPLPQTDFKFGRKKQSFLGLSDAVSVFAATLV